MGEQDIHKIPEIFVEEKREADKTDREIILTPEESEFLLQAMEGQFEKHPSFEGVEIRQLDIAKIPVDIQKKIEIIKGKVTAFSAIKIEKEVPLHQHISDEEIYFGGKNGIVTLLDASKREIGKFDLSDNTFSVAKMGNWHGVKSKEGSIFFGVKYTTNETELLKIYFGHNEKLSMDYGNAYSALYSGINHEKANIDNLRHIKTYEEYFQDKPNGALIKELSDENTIKNLDSLVNEFNKLVDEKDEEKIKSKKEDLIKILVKIDDLVKGRSNLYE